MARKPSGGGKIFSARWLAIAVAIAVAVGVGAASSNTQSTPAAAQQERAQ